MVLQSLASICEQIPCPIMDLISNIVKFIKIGVPVALIIVGMIDLGKSVVASKQDDIKKNQKVFLKRLISAALVFLVVAFVELMLGLISTDDDSVTKCIDAIIDPDHNNIQCTS